MTDITYTFHRDGAIQQVIDAAGTRTFAYDSDRRLSTETFPDLFDDGSDARVLTRKYETTGANKGRYLGFKLGDASDDDADMETSYAFDSYGRFEKIWVSAETGTADFDYNFIANSDLVAKLTGPATYLQYTYETNRDLPTYLYNKENSGGTNRATYQVTRNGLGQQTVLKGYGSAFSSKNSIQHDFSYDDRREVIGDLIKRGLSATDTTPNNTTEGTLGYDFDAIGSRDNASYDPGAAGSSGGAKVTNIYSSNNVNEYTSIGGVSPSPVHDDDGNLTSMGGVTFKWDGDNRLIEVDTGDEVIEFAYDYRGRRFRKTVTVSGSTQSDIGFIYDGWNLIAEYDLTSSNPTLEKTHYWGKDLSGGLRGAGGVGGLLATELHTGDDDGIYYTGYAPNGNLTEMFDSTGANVAHYEYDAFGQTINSSGSLKDEFTFRFSTKYFDDETGLYYYGFRYYNPVTGRWLNRDPIGEHGGLNLYGFVGNNGVSWFDYLGMDPRDMRDMRDMRDQMTPLAMSCAVCHGDPSPGGFVNLAAFPHLAQQAPPGQMAAIAALVDTDPHGWNGALLDLSSWLAGAKSEDSNYEDGGNGNGKVDDMKKSMIAEQLRSGFLNKNSDAKCPDWERYVNVKLSFRLRELIGDAGNGTAQFVGSARGDVEIQNIDTENCLVTAKFKITNITHMNSFLYHIWPESLNNTNPGTPTDIQKIKFMRKPARQTVQIPIS